MARRFTLAGLLLWVTLVALVLAVVVPMYRWRYRTPLSGMRPRMSTFGMSPRYARAGGSLRRRQTFDGNRDTDWNSGNYAPGWLEADLGIPVQLATIQLLPCQDIVGETTHEIWASDEPIGDDCAKATLVHTLHGEANNQQPLTFEFPKNLHARYVQIRTTQSPTWIAWWEVEIRVHHAD